MSRLRRKKQETKRKIQVRVCGFNVCWYQLIDAIFRFDLRGPCAIAHSPNFASMLMFRFATHHILGSLSSFNSLLFNISYVREFSGVSQAPCLLDLRGITC